MSDLAKKLISVACWVLAVVIIIVILPFGTIHNVEIDYGTTTKFEPREVKAAVRTVLLSFLLNIDCDLKELSYDEERSRGFANDYEISKYGEDNLIVVFGVYETGSGKNATLRSNTLYPWCWVLARYGKGFGWMIIDTGFPC